MTTGSADQPDDSVFHDASLRAFQCGVIVRSSKNIIAANSLDNITNICKCFFDELDLSGYFRISMDDEISKSMFGKGISRIAADTLKNNTQTGNQKVLLQDGFLIVNTSSTYFFLSTEKLSASYIDILKDNLVFFVDVIEAWCINHLQKKSMHRDFECARSNLTDKLKDSVRGIATANKYLIENYYSMSEDLLTSLVVRFPTLALEADQEEMILDIINLAINKQLGAILHQIESNNKLCDVIGETFDTLTDIAKDEDSFDSFSGQSCELAIQIF